MASQSESHPVIFGKQFEWDGTEDAREVWGYACSLGPIENARLQGEGDLVEVGMTEAEAAAVVLKHRWRRAREGPLGGEEEARVDALLEGLKQRIDLALPTNGGRSNGWFVKTKRHSPKDSPVDDPTEEELALFREEMKKRGIDKPLDHHSDPDAVESAPA